ncbi:MAG: M23 family metallopeptidase [Clostridia bacterium]|nr:M23 family metallopeptidase [Clostridia bacterium]
MNNRFKIVIFLLLLFIPTYVAIATYLSAQGGQVEDSRDVVKMSIVDPDGGTHIFTPENKGDNAEALNKEAAAEIAFMTSLNRNARKQETMPDAIADAETFTVTYEVFNRKSVYEYYFTEDPGAAFLKDPDGEIYKITSEDASAFLCKNYAACLYNGSVYPVLKIGETTVLPQKLDWRYQLFNGTYRPLDTQTTPDTHNYRMNARLAFSFNIEPDVIDITVYDKDKVIYKDNYANLSQIKITEQTQLRFHIEAKWYEVDGKEGQGEAVYDFMATVNAPASFHLNTTTITNGDFCVITVKDKPEDSDILFTSEPDLGAFTPVFVEDGDYYRALVPFSYEQPAGVYTFTLSCDGVTQELVLNVSEKEYKEVSMTVSQAVINATRTEATLAAYAEIMTPIAKSLNIATDHLFDGTFAQGTPDDAQIRAGYGRIRVINNGASYQNPGVVYMLSEGHQISAVNNGVVIFVGETDLSGVTVVVEHGLGLKSWYKNLSEAVVSVGDTVNRGDLIAYSGSTGFCDMASVQIDLTVFDVPVCPYSYWETPVLLPNP